MFRYAFALLCGGVLCASAVVAQEPLPDPLAAGWKGEPVCENLVEDDAHRILRCTFPPGVGHERHFHAAHTGYVLEGGRMRVTNAEGVRDIDVQTGGTWVSEGFDWHEALNIGETTASYLIVEVKEELAE